MTSLILSLLISSPFPALAQESVCFEKGNRPPDAYPCMRNGDTLYVNGDLHFDVLYYELRDHDPERKLRRIELNSTGGNIAEMEKVAEMIRERGMTTHVRGDSVCMSACTMLYQAGATRTAEKAAVFLYHTVRNNFQYGEAVLKECAEKGENWCKEKKEEIRADLQKSTDLFFDLLHRYGLNPALLRDFIALPVYERPDEVAEQEKKGNFLLRRDLKMTAEKAKEYGAVQELLD